MSYFVIVTSFFTRLFKIKIHKSGFDGHILWYIGVTNVSALRSYDTPVGRSLTREASRAITSQWGSTETE